MDRFSEPMITISQEQYDYFKDCERLVNLIWRKFGPYNWPKEFRVPNGISFRDLSESDREFYQVRSDFDRLFDFDDSE